MKKLLGVLGLAAVGLVANQTYASIVTQGSVEGHVTTLSVNDKSIENGVPESELQLTFDTAGTQCSVSKAAGVTYSILRSQQSAGVFDNLVKTAQAAYLSGKPLRFVSATTSSATNPPPPCYAYYMQLK